MMDLASVGRLLVGFGLILLFLGMVLMVASRIPVFDRLGRLPGDIRVQGENFACFAPITTMILVSILLTIILNVAVRLLNR